MVNEVLIIIPTRNRWEKLQAALKSIPNHDWIRICVVCDGDETTHVRLMDEYGFSTIQQPRKFSALISTHSGSVYCRNWATQHLSDDGVVMATDDITFDSNSIEMARWWINNKYPDGDGVIGFKQRPTAFHKTGVCMVGKKWLERYKNKWMYNPCYYHFACPEILWLANRIGDKFFQSPDSTVEHLQDFGDSCAVDARIHKKRDHGLLSSRKTDAENHDGPLWGDDD